MEAARPSTSPGSARERSRSGSFDYPPEIRKVMYTTNAIEATNAQLRKVPKKRGTFPGPEAVRKVL